jgi:uncharacterized protein (TIGR02099 family)
MMDDAKAPTTLLRAFAFMARWSLGLTLSAWLLFGAAWGALHWIIVPRIGDFRPALETQASRMMGVTVKIGGISAQSDGMIPSFELTDVRLHDAQGRDALSLKRILVALSPKSILSLGFEQIYIEQPHLDVRRDAAGKITVAGLDFSNSSSGDGQAADWVFSQAELAIRNGTITWTDALRGNEPVALTQVDLVLRNKFRNHGVRLDATPPVVLGDRFSLMATFKQPLLSIRNGQWRDWDGQLYGVVQRVDLAQLRRHADLGVDVAQGTGALRAWVDVNRAQANGATADVALAQVQTRLGNELVPLELRSVAGRLGGRRLSGGFEFSTEGLQFETRDGLRWPGGNLRLMHVGGEGKVPGRGEFVADKLDLQAVAEIAGHFPLGDASQAVLAQWRGKGLVQSVKATWSGPLDRPDKYQAKGRVTGMELASKRPQGPGIKGASVDFDFDQSGGKTKLAIDNGQLDLPAVFEDPAVVVTTLSADVLWQREGERLAIQIPALKFSNPDAQGEAQIKWQTSATGAAVTAKGAVASTLPAGFPGVLDLQGTLSRAEGKRVHRYLPLVMNPKARDYVREAVLQGVATAVKFKVKGDLHDMPFIDAHPGEFKISATVKDATFAYLPHYLQAPDALPWPELTQLAGELVIDRQKLELKNLMGRLNMPASASTPGAQAGGGVLQISKADGLIADLLNNATVVVNAEAKGALPQWLAVVNGSPLGRLVGQAFAKTTSTGAADVKLKFSIPLLTPDKLALQGSVSLPGNDIQIAPAAPLLARARGTVNFTESGFSIVNAQARMLGGDVRFEGGSVAAPVTAPTVPLAAAVGGATASGVRPLPAIVLRAQGNVTAEALRQAKDLGLVSRLAQQATGSANYTAVLGFRRGVPEILVSSNLVGLALDLPSPVGKAADTPLPLRFETSLLREPAITAPASGARPPDRLQDQLQLDLGRLASVLYVRDISGPEPRVLRGSIGIGLAADESAPLPEDGVVANVNLNTVDLDAWNRALTQAAGTQLVSQAAPGAGNNASPSLAQAYLPNSMALRARELTAGGRKLTQVVVGGSRDGLTWRANLDATELNGYAEYRQPSGNNAGRVYARLARLTLAASSASDVESLLDEQPVNIPALDIVVDDLELRGRKLGRVEIDAINRGAGAVAREGGVREWRLNKFNVILPEAEFTATGNWANVNAQSQPIPNVQTVPERRRTVMNFKLDIKDSGELLNRMGMKDVIRKGKGKLEGQVSWLGSPLGLDYPTLTGKFGVNVETGQFLKADPGLAKLLGVLSLQSLPRRLALDFRDVFSEGFVFDFVRGDVTIEQGIASTNNLQMKGVNAAVLMDGRADIARETQDIKVVVVPEINAGTASLIASAINPAVGLGTFLAQVLLRGPLIESSTQEFHIDGTWVDPKVTKVARRSASAAADAKRPGE